MGCPSWLVNAKSGTRNKTGNGPRAASPDSLNSAAAEVEAEAERARRFCKTNAARIIAIVTAIPPHTIHCRLRAGPFMGANRRLATPYSKFTGAEPALDFSQTSNSLVETTLKVLFMVE